MTKYQIPNMTSGMDEVLVDTARTIPSFIPMFLAFIWGVIFIGGGLAQKRRTGYMDIPMWATVASFATCMFAAPMMFTSGEMMIQGTTIAILLSITGLSGLWLILKNVFGR